MPNDELQEQIFTLIGTAIEEERLSVEDAFELLDYVKDMIGFSYPV